MVKEEFDKRWPSDQGPPSKINERKGDSKSEINEKKEGLEEDQAAFKAYSFQGAGATTSRT